MRERLEYLKTIAKIASGFVPYVAEWDFSKPLGKYRVPFTIISGTARWTGLLLGFTKDPIAYHMYTFPTVAEVSTIARDEISKLVS